MPLQLNQISKRYETVEAVKQVHLTIEDGELLVLVGPSGCGKTTILRMIAGLVDPDDGTIVFKGHDLTRMPPEKRPTVTVFQDYALFPHMNVAQNIAYGLKVRGSSRPEIRDKVNQYMKLMKIEGLEHRSISALSGGQKQRVALARAMVVDPDILLFDEPLSSLDAKLRVDMREEIRNIQQQTGITAVYVTHDQEEALAIADRVAVMNNGLIEQIGTPEEIYYQPATAFVSDFIGFGNFVSAVLRAREGDLVRISMLGMETRVPLSCFDRHALPPENPADLQLFFRPEDVTPDENGPFEAAVIQKSFLGAVTRFLIRTDNGIILKMDMPSGLFSLETGAAFRFAVKRLQML